MIESCNVLWLWGFFLVTVFLKLMPCFFICLIFCEPSPVHYQVCKISYHLTTFQTLRYNNFKVFLVDLPSAAPEHFCPQPRLVCLHNPLNITLDLLLLLSHVDSVSWVVHISWFTSLFQHNLWLLPKSGFMRNKLSLLSLKMPFSTLNTW